MEQTIEDAAEKILGKRETEKKNKWFDNECKAIIAMIRYLKTGSERDHRIY